MGYRDANAALRGRLAEISLQVQQIRGQLSEAYWSAFDAETRERAARLDALSKASFADLALDAMTAAEQQLTSYLRELQERVQRLPELEASWWQALPDDVQAPIEQRKFWSMGWQMAWSAREIEKAFLQLVRSLDPEAQLSKTSHSLEARYRRDGAPFFWRLSASINKNGEPMELASELTTSVRRSLPSLTLQSESFASTITKAVGLRRELEVGELSFDGQFLINGDRSLPAEQQREQVMPLLDAPLRAAILALAKFDVPSLSLEPSVPRAVLRWRYPELDPRVHALAEAILLQLREHPGTVQLRA